jgi:phenylacetate-CoA ligase
MIPDKRLIYDNCPEVVKNMIGFGLRRFPRFRWRPTKEETIYFESLVKTEYAPTDVLKRLQCSKLKKLINHAAVHVPYYRKLFNERGLRPEDFQSLDDLQKLPLLTKEMIRANPDDFLSNEICDRATLTKITTGGSTGTPMQYYFDAHMIGVRRATWWRWSMFAGIELYADRMIYCGGAPQNWIYPPEDFSGLVNYERNQLFLSSAAMSNKVLDRYIEDMKKFKGDYIRGYASGTYMLAHRVIEKGLVLPMKAVLTSSDTLFPQYRDTIEKAFSCKVYDHYGQNEDILTATECGVSPGLHVNMESCIAETVNEKGEPVLGTEGKFVSTHLENFVTPLIRYVVGDVGILDSSSKKCECGRHHQKILSFTGRDDEIIVTPEGRRIGCGSMNQPMKTMHSSIQRCQFVQESINLLKVKIIPTDAWADSVHRVELEANIRMQVGDKIGLEIEKVKDIPARENGKYQFIVSKISSKKKRTVSE